jgi:hypothetical protein
MYPHHASDSDANDPCGVDRCRKQSRRKLQAHFFSGAGFRAAAFKRTSSVYKLLLQLIFFVIYQILQTQIIIYIRELSLMNTHTHILSYEHLLKTEPT